MTNTLLVEPMLADYTATDAPGWTHENVGHHFVVNSKFGQLEIGMVPGKSWDQWLFHENAGGGSLVIGYAEIDNELHVLMLKANRFNLVGDSDDYEGPGGFKDEDDSTKLVTAVRELLEETDQLANPEPVSGRGYVGNRAFFQLASEDEGTSVFAFELTDEQVTATNDSDKLALMPWRDAIRTTRDALTGMAIARLVADKL
jgi:8-oxo-dGTP pyrophosphatase MutT (NUDIX family)